MSEFQPFPSSDLIHVQFRHESHPVPHVRNLEQLGEVIDARVKPGLNALNDVLHTKPELSAKTAYVGYALATYIHPLQRIEFRIFDPNDPRRTQQDFYLQQDDCFDLAMARRDLPYRRQHVRRQADFREYGYVLGPVVRGDVDPLHVKGDGCNQYANLAFSTRFAAFIPGEVLLAGLREANPGLHEGFAIASYAPHEYLTARFDLQPKY